MNNQLDTILTEALEWLGAEVNDIAHHHGFWEGPQNKAEKIALMHSELSEALEAIRKPDLPGKLDGIPLEAEELADCVIRIVDYCHEYDIPLAAAITRKSLYNERRPYKHGKEF